MRLSTAAARGELQAFLDTHLGGLQKPQVMDAGCGGALRIRLPGDAVLNGIDICEESAARNTGLARVIIGDVQTYPLPRKSFDIVICWELLEHVPDPCAALANLFAAIKPDGFIILAFPNRASLKGLITRLSPHALHVWLLRHFWGQKNAGRAGYAPFPTYLAPELEPGRIQDFIHSRGMEAVFTRLYEGNRIATLRRRAPLLHACYQGFLELLNALALRRHDFGLSDVLLVVKRPREPRLRIA